ncbi:hypothetical protein PoB_001009100 [Plakobranchus ocellatus]|uniref:Uncharacterized protein n=1 Tax=Plakobranchus ocellatus TaxID=259542 RepID=A0AAV3Y8K4_9GAST|nr:hypothetical protein PoB_001009100 [Plakobranchus ocellatus]
MRGLSRRLSHCLGSQEDCLTAWALKKIVSLRGLSRRLSPWALKKIVSLRGLSRRLSHCDALKKIVSPRGLSRRLSHCDALKKIVSLRGLSRRLSHCDALKKIPGKDAGTVPVVLIRLPVSGASVFVSPPLCGEMGRSPATGKVSTSRTILNDTVAAELKNDPTLTNFNNETVSFPYPCRFLVTHVRQELKDRDRNVIGHCEFKINYDDGRMVKLSSRNYGVAMDGSYRFERQGTVGEYLPDGPWDDDEIAYRDNDNGIRVQIFENSANNQLVYQFRRCGLRVTFVPYDLINRRQQMSVPGLSVAINCAMHPQWYGYETVMGLSPVMDGGVLFQDLRLHGLDDEQSMVVRAFTRGYIQNQPYDDQGMCEMATWAFSNCSPNELKNAIDNCYWMLRQPRFVRCFDPTRSAMNILQLLSSCVNLWCDHGYCPDVQRSISNSGCDNVRRIPQLPMFMAGTMCP